jgi:hypothetical protein
MATTENTMNGTDYESWLSALHAKTARRLATEARAGVAMTGDVLSDLLDNLSAIAERDAGL